MVLFLAVDLTVSAAAVLRWKDRLDGVPPSGVITQTLDRLYDNETMTAKFPKVFFE